MSKKREKVVKEPEQESPAKEIKLEETQQYRYVGKTINHFVYGEQMYQLIPNTVYVNLPDCDAVRRLLQKGELQKI